MTESFLPRFAEVKGQLCCSDYLKKLCEAHVITTENSAVDLTLVALLCRRGSTEGLRAVFWKLLLGFLPLDTSRWEQVMANKTLEYRNLLCSLCLLDESGDVVFDKCSYRAVDIDIPRTMPSMHFFRMLDVTTTSVTEKYISDAVSPVQQRLRRILYTLAGVNKGLGYVQGMNELVGHLLYAFAGGQCEAVNDTVEAEVFFCFQAMLSYLGDVFCCSLDFDNNTGVMGTIRHFGQLFQCMEPELWSHFETCQVKPEFYAFRWITLLFTQEFNVPDVFRVWDFLFSFAGELRSAVLYVSVAMLSYQRDVLMQMDKLCQILPLLQSYPPCDVNDFLNISMKWIDCYGFCLVKELRVATTEDVSELRRRYKISTAGNWSWKSSIYGWIGSVKDFSRHLKNEY